MANVLFLLTRDAVAGNDFIDWKTIEPVNGGALAFPTEGFTGQTAGGRDFTLEFNCLFTRNEQGPPSATWSGCFGQEDGLLCNGTTTNPFVIRFPNATCFAVGTQMEPDAVLRRNDSRSFLGYVSLLGQTLLPVAGHNQINGGARILKVGDQGDDTAIFTGADFADGFQAVEFYAEARKPSSKSKATLFAVNRIELRF